MCVPSWQPTTTLLTNQTDKKVHPFICVPSWQPTTTLHHKRDRQEGSAVHVRTITTANDYSTWQTRQTRRFIHSYACHPDSQRLLYITNQTDKKVHPFICVPSWQPTTTLHHKPDRQEGSAVHMRAITTANDYTTSQTRQTRRFSRSCAYHPDSQQLLYLQTRQTRRFIHSYACHPDSQQLLYLQTRQTRRFIHSYACHHDSQRLLYMTNQTDKKVHPFICVPSRQPTTTLHDKPDRQEGSSIHMRAILTANNYSTYKPDRQEGSSIHMRAILTANDYSTWQTRQTRRFIHSYACHHDSQRLLYMTNQTDKKFQPFMCVPSWQPTTTLHHKPHRQEGSSIHMHAILTANDYSTSQTRQTRRFRRSYACHPDSQRLHYITNQTDKKVQPFICVPS